jgi:hypothetical protein
VTGALLAGDPSDGIGQMVPEHGSGMTLGHVGERRGPGDPRSDANQFFSRHSGNGVQFLFAENPAYGLLMPCRETSRIER